MSCSRLCILRPSINFTASVAHFVYICSLITPLSDDHRVVEFFRITPRIILSTKPVQINTALHLKEPERFPFVLSAHSPALSPDLWPLRFRQSSVCLKGPSASAEPQLITSTFLWLKPASAGGELLYIYINVYFQLATSTQRKCYVTLQSFLLMRIGK